jgi:hypothetical protein
MTTTAAKTTETRRHVLLAIRNGQPEIVQVFGRIDQAGAWGQAIDAHAVAQSEADAQGVKASELHYAVRESDHELVQAAAAAVARKLGKAQRQALTALAKSTKPGQAIKPGSRKMGSTDPRRWAEAGGQYSADAAAPLRGCAKHGLVRITGLDFAPKTYLLTAKGRLVAAAL